MEYALTATKNEAPAGSYYDRIARLYDLTFKVNGYGRSLDQYFAAHPLPISRGAKILDAGCGTGLLTLAVLRSIRFPVSITALDYVPLAEGINELARVIVPGGHLLHLPVHPSFIGVCLEILFRFKSHPPREVKDQTEHHFRIVHQYRFRRREAIGWSKTAILAQKV